MYYTEPPTDKKIREWYMNSNRMAACALRNEQAATLLEHLRPDRIRIIKEMPCSVASGTLCTYYYYFCYVCVSMHR